MTTNNPVYTYTEEERELDRRAEARAGAWMKVQRNATMVQRPDLYSQAIAMPALDASDQISLGATTFPDGFGGC